MNGEGVLRFASTTILNDRRAGVALLGRTDEADVAVQIMCLHSQTRIVSVDQRQTRTEISVVHGDLRNEMLILGRVLTDQGITARTTSIRRTAHIHTIEIITVSRSVIRTANKKGRKKKNKKKNIQEGKLQQLIEILYVRVL